MKTSTISAMTARRLFAIRCRSFSSRSGLKDEIFHHIRTKKAVVIGNASQPDMQRAVKIFGSHGKTACEVIDLEKAGKERADVERHLFQYSCRKATPLVFVKGDCVGSVADLEKLNSKGVIQEWLKDHEFDLVVIGGGSGGLAAAQEAANFSKKIACLDFVVPTPIGTNWGLGGTCVNVGCIPKKLMHQAALLGRSLDDARAYGWKLDEKVSHDWITMKNAVQAHVSSLVWNSRVNLNQKEVKYFNAYGKFVGSHTLAAVDKKGKEVKITSDRFLVATGIRPRYPNIPGAKEYCITSDDVFKLAYPPGKTLVVGASYVALECAGFLAGIGFDVTVMVRSILLRGFDQDMAERIGKYMSEFGIRFIHETVPTKVEQIEAGKPGRLRVTAKSNDGREVVDEYNTVLLATGRHAVTDDMGLETAGVERNEKNKKIVTFQNEQSVSAPHVYAVGDVMDGGNELTPVAIQAARLLARRLYGDSTELCDYTNVPTTVFTPLEYGCCGMIEEDAIKKFGADAIEVFHLQFDPLEFTVPHRKELDHCYAKMVCNKNDDMRVLGIHILGPNAGEVIQGFSIGLKMRARKADFDNLIGIHPTVAELFTTLQVTKASKKVYKQGQC